MSTRLAGALVALLATVALVAGCGGGDSSEASSTAAPETVTVTAEAPVAAEPVDVTTTEAPAEPPAEPPSVSDVDPGDMQAVIDMYKSSLGLSDTEARCVLDKAMKLEDIGDLDGATPDMSALMGSGIMSVFTDCGVDFNTLIERMSQNG